jgi:hypothetical protein
LLADRPELLDGDHLGAVDVNRIGVQLPLNLTFAILKLAHVHRELALLIGADHEGISADGLTTSAEGLVFGLFDELELELVAAPPRLLVEAEDPGLGFKTLIEGKRQSNPILTGGAVRATGSGQPKPLA